MPLIGVAAVAVDIKLRRLSSDKFISTAQSYDIYSGDKRSIDGIHITEYTYPWV